MNELKDIIKDKKYLRNPTISYHQYIAENLDKIYNTLFIYLKI